MSPRSLVLFCKGPGAPSFASHWDGTVLNLPSRQIPLHMPSRPWESHSPPTGPRAQTAVSEGLAQATAESGPWMDQHLGSPSGISPGELPGSVSPEPAPAPGMPRCLVLCHLMGNRLPVSSYAPSPRAGVSRWVRAPSLPPPQHPDGSHLWHVCLWVCFSWFVRTLKYLGILGAGL